ncbi:MAG: helix-turn-helix domain-containing protein [Chloroflexota bacterium]|nr:helix-turn-helix domain-containing protein [Chloroflexota bacterium]
MDEESRRRKAIELLDQGVRPSEVLRRLERSRDWLSKWRRRFDELGAAGLVGRSHAPRHHPWTTSARVVRAIVAARERLERRARGRGFAGVGSDAVAWELELARVRPLPSRRTIERVLARHGRTARVARPAPRPPAEPYPAPMARRPGDLQQTDLVGPRHLRTPRGPEGFYSFHTVDVAGGGAASFQFPDKSGESFCRYLAEIAWPALGIPRIWQVDNESALAGLPGQRHIFTQPVRLALLLGAEVRFIPEGEPGRNADVESYNALWQARVLHRFDCPGLARLARVSARFDRWYMEARPHPKLSVAQHGTRFPAALLASLDGALPRPPRRFSIDDHRGAQGEIRLPLARGRISWVRRVDEHGRLRLIDQQLRLGRRAANQYVVATLSTGIGEIRVWLGTEIVSRFPFDAPERVVHPLVRRGR